MYWKSPLYIHTLLSIILRPRFEKVYSKRNKFLLIGLRVFLEASSIKYGLLSAVAFLILTASTAERFDRKSWKSWTIDLCVYIERKREREREREREQEETINLQNAIFLRQLSCEMFVARKSTFKECDFARFPRNDARAGITQMRRFRVRPGWKWTILLLARARDL